MTGGQKYSPREKITEAEEKRSESQKSGLVHCKINIWSGNEHRDHDAGIPFRIERL